MGNPSSVEGHWVHLLYIVLLLQLPVADPFLEKVSLSDLGEFIYALNYVTK